MKTEKKLLVLSVMMFFVTFSLIIAYPNFIQADEDSVSEEETEVLSKDEGDRVEIESAEIQALATEAAVKNDFAYDESKKAWYYYDENGEIATSSGIVHGTVDGVEGDYYINSFGKKQSTNGIVTISSVYYYLSDGRVQTEFTGLYKYNSTKYYYFVNGVDDRTLTGFITETTDEYGSGEYYVSEGIVTVATKFQKTDDGSYYYLINGMKCAEDGFYYGNAGSTGDWYVKDGKVQKDTSGFISGTIDGVQGEWYVDSGKVVTSTAFKQASDGTWYYLVDGQRCAADGFYNGKVDSTSGWWYVKSGIAQTSKTGFVNGTIDGTEGDYYVEKGQALTTKTDLVKVDGKYYYVKNGVKNSLTGFVSSSAPGSSGTWYVKDGVAQTSATGLYSGTINGNTGKYYVKSGKAQTTTNGFTKVSGTYYYLNKGMLKEETGLQYGDIDGIYARYYIKKGVYTKSTGVFYYLQTTNSYYYTVNGAVYDGYTGCYNDGSTVWYIKNGEWQSKTTGVYTDSSGKMWYVKNGKADKSYSGTKTYNGIKYTIKKGVATYNSINGIVTGGSSSVRSRVNKNLKKINSKLLAIFAQQGGTITCTNSSLGKSKKYGAYWGTTVGAKIKLKNTKSAADWATIHEFGHWFDYYSGKSSNRSSTQEWKDIMNSEIKKFRKAFGKSNISPVVWAEKDVSEYFAEVFKFYYKNGSKLKKNCPKSYNAMKALISNAVNGKINTTYLETPKLKSVEGSDGSVKLTWRAVKGVNKYRVFRKTGKNGSWTGLTNTTSTSYTDKTAKKGTTYYYTVRCINNMGTAYQSSYDSSGLSMCLRSTPSLKKASASKTGITVTWNKVSGAKKYRVYRKTGKNGSWKRIGTTSGTSYKDTTDKKGTTYYYTVRCIDGNGNTTSGYVKAGVSAKSARTEAKYKATTRVRYRSGPGTKYQKKGTLKKGQTITVDATYSKKVKGTTWWRFKKNGKWYYVPSNYLKKA